jgi:hypothetical protein
MLDDTTSLAILAASLGVRALQNFWNASSAIV